MTSKPWRKENNVREVSTKLVGCICPIQNGCRIRQPIDPANVPVDAVRVVCTNGEKCKQIPFIHSVCFDQWTESLLKDYKSLGNRARNDAKMERYFAINNDHLWGTQAYGKLQRFCKCPCGGSLKKYLDLTLPTPHQQTIAPASVESSKNCGGTKTSNKKQLPKLVTSYPARVKGPSLLGSAVWKQNSNNCNNNNNNNNNTSNSRTTVAHGRTISESGTGDLFGERALSANGPYVPPGLYVCDNPPKAIRPSLLLRKVDTSVASVSLASAGVVGGGGGDNGKTKAGKCSRQLTTANVPPNVAMLPSINSEEELMDELNALIEDVPEGMDRDELTDIVNNVLGRAIVEVCSVVADAGGIWEYLKQKSVEEAERERNNGGNDKQHFVLNDNRENGLIDIIDELDSGCGCDNPSSSSTNVSLDESLRVVNNAGVTAAAAAAAAANFKIPLVINEYVQFCSARSSMSAFCYRESLAHVELLLKQCQA